MSDSIPAPTSESVRASDFGANFLWGAATAAYQIEGGFEADGKGPSIWDDFARRGKIRKNHTGNVACDHYHRMPEDVELMQSLGLQAYRFSISWPRILPDGRRRSGVNLPGLDFYKRLVERLQKAGIRPVATLYHWDLPLELERAGGWKSREIADHFAEYAALCAEELGESVKDWVVLNEPFVFLLLGYGVRYFPPQHWGLRSFLKSSHYAMLAQGRAFRAIRAARSDLRIGTTVSTLAGEAASDSKRDQEALSRHDAFFNRLYVDPFAGRGYPEDALPVLRKIERYVKPGDMEEVQTPFDFLGVNHYSRKIVQAAWWIPWLGFYEHKPAKGAVRTDMGWEVHPPGIYQILKKFAAYPEIPELMITENGAAYDDPISPDGRVRDPRRISYLREYIGECLRAKQEGAPLTAYFVWSLLDNLEWREGYDKRFGIIRVDFDSLRRTLKDSAFWYRDFIQS